MQRFNNIIVLKPSFWDVCDMLLPVCVRTFYIFCYIKKQENTVDKLEKELIFFLFIF